MIMENTIAALMQLQQKMKGEAEDAGFANEEDIAEWISKSRREKEKDDD